MARFIPVEVPPAPPEPCYNEPIYNYNEPCLCYNGGWDLICLFGEPDLRRIAGTVTRKPVKPRQYPEPGMVDLLFKTSIICVNDCDTDDSSKWDQEKRYSFKKESDIQVNASELSVKIKTTGPKVTAAIESVEDAYIDEDHISASKDVIRLENKKTSMSSSLSKLKSYVSSSLRLDSPRKIIIKSTSIKVKKKD